MILAAWLYNQGAQWFNLDLQCPNSHKMQAISSVMPGNRFLFTGLHTTHYLGPCNMLYAPPKEVGPLAQELAVL